MSTPPFLALPPRARPARLRTRRWPLAAVVADPDPAVPERGTALLLPGFTGSKEDFLALLAPLSAEGWRVVAVDQAGQFESPGPDDPSAYALAALADDALDLLLALRSAYGPPVHLLGHSLGGLVAAEAVRRSACAGACADSVTLLCSGPGALPEGRREIITALRAALPTMTLEEVWQAKEALDQAAGVPAPDPDVHAFLHRRFVSTSPVGLAVLADVLHEAPDDTAGLARALGGVPVLVAYGEGDDAWPLPDQDRMARRLGTTAVVIPGCGHSPAAEAPLATAAALGEFWRGVTAGSRHARREGGRKARVLPRDAGYKQAVHLDLPLQHDARAVALARREVVASLERWGIESLSDDAALVSSELVTNALRHAQSPMSLRLCLAAGVVRVEVSDGTSDRVPAPRDAGLADPGGRGCRLLEALVDRWGWDCHADGKRVWAEWRLVADPLPADPLPADSLPDGAPPAALASPAP